MKDEDLPKSRKEALEQGITHYFTGKPCRPKGHISRRNAKAGVCLQCRREVHNKERDWTEYRKRDTYKEYQREYHKKYAQTEHGRAVKAAANERWRAKKKGENNGKDN